MSTAQPLPFGSIVKSNASANTSVVVSKASVNLTSDAKQTAVVNEEELKKSVDTINKYLKSFNNSMEFSVDKDSGQIVVKLIDTETQSVIKQTPSKEALEIAQDLKKAQGMFIHTKA